MDFWGAKRYVAPLSKYWLLALIANSVFFKTLSKSIYTSNMIKGGGQGRKITDPKFLWYMHQQLFNVESGVTLKSSSC